MLCNNEPQRHFFYVRRQETLDRDVPFLRYLIHDLSTFIPVPSAPRYIQ